MHIITCTILIQNFKSSNRSNSQNTKSTIMRNQQKNRNEKRREPSKTSLFFIFLSSFFVFTTHNHQEHRNVSVLFLCKWLWQVKTKKEERKKKKEGVLEGYLLFSFLPFSSFLIIVDHREIYKSKFGRLLYFVSSNCFELLKF